MDYLYRGDNARLSMTTPELYMSSNLEKYHKCGHQCSGQFNGVVRTPPPPPAMLLVLPGWPLEPVGPLDQRYGLVLLVL